MRILNCLFYLFITGCLADSVLAQNAPVETPAAGGQKPNPIEVYFSTLSGLRYLQDDQLLSDKDLRETIAAQSDPEGGRLLEKSRNSSQLGVWGMGIGLATVTAGVVAATDNVKDTNNVAVGLGTALGGLCLTAAGGLFAAEGNSAKFNAVQRYDRLVWGENNPVTVSDAAPKELKIHPIDVRLSTLGGFGYSLQGREMAWPKDFEERIGSLRDFETTRLLNRSKSSGDLSQVFLGLGIGGEIAVIALNAGTSSGGNRVGFWLPFIGSLLADEIGAYFQMESSTAKFNAVKRYNRFARGQEQVLPQASQDDKALMDFSSPNAAPPK